MNETKCLKFNFKTRDLSELKIKRYRFFFFWICRDFFSAHVELTKIGQLRFCINHNKRVNNVPINIQKIKPPDTNLVL